MMVEIKAGPELDMAVADAIGQPYASDAPAGFVGIWDKWGPNLEKYSTDLNAAFEAAEKVGFFRWLPEQAFVLGYRDDGMWSVQDVFNPTDSYKGSTPALAICAAILALKRGERDESWKASKE